MTDEEAIALALAEAKAAALRGEVPVGAALLSGDGALLAKDGNRIVENKDPTAHAEMLVMRAGALKLGNERLTGTQLFVSLEPCAMCAGAISHARIGRVVFGAEDPKGGAVVHGPRFFAQPTCHWRPEVTGGVLAEESAELLRGFFRGNQRECPPSLPEAIKTPAAALEAPVNRTAPAVDAGEFPGNLVIARRYGGNE